MSVRQTGDPKSKPPFRKVALYTAELTPRFEVPEEVRVVIDPILWDKPFEIAS